jgi:2-desacetyl-2-hydroxyethyl bacteriochlorophyllide A dehydrogenase
MKGAVYRGPGKIELDEVEVPEVSDGFVLVDTKVTGICGSDLHRYFGEWEQPEMAPGHEISGVVSEVGEGVEGIKVGDRVCVECFSHCGRCRFCEIGLYNLCENRIYLSRRGMAGFCEYSLIPSSSIFKLPQNLTFEQGVLVEPLAVSYRAFMRSGSDYKNSVVVIGAGTIGLFCLASAKAVAVPITAIVAKYDHQARMAEKMGADYVLRVPTQDIREAASSITDELGFDVVIDTVASAQSLQDALAMVRRAGIVVLVGGYTKAFEVSMRPVVNNELSVLGSMCYGYSGLRTDFDASIDLIESGRIDASAIITHRFPLEDIAEAFQVAADKNSGSIKVLIVQ